MKNICLIIGLILSFSVFCFGQKADRIIDFYPNQPEGNFSIDANRRYVPTTMKGVELVCISFEGKTVTPGNTFAAGDDWLKTLTVKLKNVSDKAISSIIMSFSRPEAKFNNSSLGFSLEFGSLSAMEANRTIKKVIQPGEEFELRQTEALYLSRKTFMIEKTGIANITQLIIGITTVEFEDGNLWTTRKITSVK